MRLRRRCLFVTASGDSGGSMSVRLFVGNLPYNATEAALREHFSAVGPLSYIYLPTDRESGKPRGFAFVEFAERPLAVNEARERESRPQSSAPRPPAPPRDLPEMPPADRPTTRNFGPDAAPRRAHRKSGGRGTKSERQPKQPIRERGGGRFFGDEGDDGGDDDYIGENFASRVTDSDDE